MSLESPDEAAALARFVRDLGTRRGGIARVDVLLRFNPAVEPETLAQLATGARRLQVRPHRRGGRRIDHRRRRPGRPAPLPRASTSTSARSSGRSTPGATRSVGRSPSSPFSAAGSRSSTRSTPAGASRSRRSASPSRDPDRFAAVVPALLAGIPAGRRPARLAIEPGRFLVARAGWLVGRVLHVRERSAPPPPETPLERSGPLGLAVVPPEARTVDRSRRLVVIDAGMTELIRPALYGGEHGIVALTSLGRPVRSARLARPAVLSASWQAAADARRALTAEQEAAGRRFRAPG